MSLPQCGSIFAVVPALGDQSYSRNSFSAARARDSCMARNNPHPERPDSHPWAALRNRSQKLSRFETDFTDNMVIALFSDLVRETRGHRRNVLARSHAYARGRNDAWTKATIARP